MHVPLDFTESDEKRRNWKTSIVCCGSNALNQLCSSDPIELMRPSFQTIEFPNLKKNLSSLKNPLLVSSGANSSIAVFEGSQHQCYLWGEGFSSTISKLPLLYSISEHRRIVQVSCGYSHAGLITDDGKVFTWGQGEHGKLGHGSKQYVPIPKLVEKLADIIALQISCGGSHTAIIASEPDLIFYVTLSSLQNHISPSRMDVNLDDKLMKCGKLYMCGLNKAGQLGLGDSSSQSNSVKHLMRSTSSNRSSSSALPTLVSHFDSENLVLAEVSCGLHHTLVIATSSYRLESHRSTSVYSFGFGDHGRLGLGDEDQRSYPCKVKLPVGFNAIQVSAGEQHSLCRGISSCYSWGNNSMGQLGAGNPSSLDQALEPVPIIMPEALRIVSLVAGARHSSAITECGKVLLWGWGEEGQLGQGTEKNSFFPRPSKLPRYEGVLGVPQSIQLGNTHSTIICNNLQYTPVDEEDAKEEILAPDILVEPEVSPPPIVELESNVEEEVHEVAEMDEETTAAQPKSVLLITDDDTILVTQRGAIEDKDPSPKLIRSFRDLLALREERE
jgi:alpha-tubulin suppressor-like RCC1 family protein